MISKKEFEDAYRKFPPNSHEKFFIERLSIHSLRSNRWTIGLFALFLLIPLLSEIACNLLNLSAICRLIPNLMYIIILAAIGIYVLYTHHKKSERLNKIRKYLKLSRKQFKHVIDTYYYNRYPTLEKYVKYHSTKTI